MEEVGDVEEEEEAAAAAVVVAAACECCGFTQECTAPYMAAVRARYGGRWICGLCGDAAGEELGRADPPISPGEALDRHAAVCRARRASVPPSPEENAGDLIAAAAEEGSPLHAEQPQARRGRRRRRVRRRRRRRRQRRARAHGKLLRGAPGVTRLELCVRARIALQQGFLSKRRNIVPLPAYRELVLECSTVVSICRKLP
jgi:hypothetical protein